MRAWLSSKFGQIRLLLSMATDRVIMEKGFTVFFSTVFYPILLNLQVMMTCMRARRSLKGFMDFSRPGFSRVVLSRPMIGPFATRYFSHLFDPSRFATSVIFAVCRQLTLIIH